LIDVFGNTKAKESRRLKGKVSCFTLHYYYQSSLSLFQKNKGGGGGNSEKRRRTKFTGCHYFISLGSGGRGGFGGGSSGGGFGGGGGGFGGGFGGGGFQGWFQRRLVKKQIINHKSCCDLQLFITTYYIS
jgi:uncharacterized protein